MLLQSEQWRACLSRRHCAAALLLLAPKTPCARVNRRTQNSFSRTKTVSPVEPQTFPNCWHQFLEILIISPKSMADNSQDAHAIGKNLTPNSKKSGWMAHDGGHSVCPGESPERGRGVGFCIATRSRRRRQHDYFPPSFANAFLVFQ